MIPKFPDRDLQTLLSVARYDTLTRAQISALHFPHDKNGRITRKRLSVLTKLGLLNQTFMRTVNPSVNGGLSSPVYFTSRKGADFCAQETGENTYQLCNTTTPHHLYLYHFVAVADTHIMLDRACRLAGIEVADWIGERALASPGEQDPQRRFRLYTRIDEKTVCVPDAGFLLKKGDFSKVFYLEQDRDTTKSAERVAAQKCNGYASMADQEMHLARHFPNATWKNFNVLCVAPTPQRRDALRKAIIKKPKGGIWKFASLTDLTPESFLTAPVWHQGEAAEPSSLLLKEGQ